MQPSMARPRCWYAQKTGLSDLRSVFISVLISVFVVSFLLTLIALSQVLTSLDGLTLVTNIS